MIKVRLEVMLVLFNVIMELSNLKIKNKAFNALLLKLAALIFASS